MNGKSGNINNVCAQMYPQGTKVPGTELLCIFDADQVASKEFFLKTVPLFDGGEPAAAHAPLSHEPTLQVATTSRFFLINGNHLGCLGAPGTLFSASIVAAAFCQVMRNRKVVTCHDC